jgi:Tat protein translocase TatB subunit
VAPGAAPSAETYGAEGKVDVVHNNKQVVDRSLVPIHRLAHRGSAEVHVRAWLEEDDLLSSIKDFYQVRAKAIASFVDRKTSRELVNNHETKVVPRCDVLPSRVPQPYDNLHKQDASQAIVAPSRCYTRAAILPRRLIVDALAGISPREGAFPMFGIGYQEMFIVLVVALVIFGPSRLPELAGQVGRWVRDFRRMSSDLTGEFEKTFAEVDEVKKTFAREMQGIQEEVEGIGKSARGDLKKSGAKAIADGKKSPGLAAKKGTAAAATASNPSRSTSSTRTSAGAKDAAANRASTKTANGSKFDGNAPEKLPIATKADPLADVSFFDLDVEFSAAKNGSSAPTNGAVGDDPAGRVRRRRAASAYAQRNSA